MKILSVFTSNRSALLAMSPAPSKMPSFQKIVGSLALLVAGCRFSPSGSPLPDGGTEDAKYDATVYEAPQLVRPLDGLVLPPTRAFLSWRYDNVPLGKTINHHEVCYTPNGMGTTCEPVTFPHYVIDPLSPTTIYEWSVRTCFDAAGTDCSPPSIQRFSTDNSLVGWWKFDEGAGELAADSSGMGNDGTLVNGPVWIPGVNGQALQFGENTNRYVLINDTAELNFGSRNFTMGAWVQSNPTGVLQSIVEKWVPGNGYYFYILANGLLGFYGESCGVTVSGGNVTDGVWHYVVVTRNVTMVTLYVDGVMDGTGTCKDNFLNTSILTVGCNSPQPGCIYPLNGNIDDVTIMGDAMSLETVQNNYRAIQR